MGYNASMIETSEIPKTYEEAVTTLARWQGEIADPDLVIYACLDPEHQVVRLIEISAGFVSTNPPHPWALGPTPYFPYRSEVLLLTPGDWEASRIPDDWACLTREQVWPQA